MDNDDRISDEELFEGFDLSRISKPVRDNTRKLYDYIVESARKADMKGEPLQSELSEGLFGTLVGGTAGALAGPVIMKAICRILGIAEDGTLGKLLTSALVCTALGAEIGK